MTVRGLLGVVLVLALAGCGAGDGMAVFRDAPFLGVSPARVPAPIAEAHCTINVEGMRDPVVQLIDESAGEVLYTLRIAGNSFRPKVFDAAASYTVVIGEPAAGRTQTISGLRIATDDTEPPPERSIRNEKRRRLRSP